jgi:hypothetical protein
MKNQVFLKLIKLGGNLKYTNKLINQYLRE